MMSGTDLTDLLKRGAGPAPQGVDPMAVWQRGRRRRTMTRLSAAAGAASVVAAVVLVQPFGGGPTPDISVGPADRPPTAESTEEVVVDDSEMMRLAAAATRDASVEDAVVSDSWELAELWQRAGIDGAAPVLPEGTVGLFVIARQDESTCRSTGDVTGVEIDDGAGVVLLDPDGEFLRPCPGPEGSGAWTAFVVAIPDRYGQDLTEASSRLAEAADRDPGGTGSKTVEGVVLEVLAEFGFRPTGPAVDGAMVLSRGGRDIEEGTGIPILLVTDQPGSAERPAAQRDGLEREADRVETEDDGWPVGMTVFVTSRDSYLQYLLLTDAGVVVQLDAEQQETQALLPELARAAADRLGQPDVEPKDADHEAANGSEQVPGAPDPTTDGTDTHVVEVYFTVSDESGHDELVAAQRTVSGPDVLTGTLESLLEGPTEQEQADGHTSWFSTESSELLLDVRIEDETAYVDFDPTMREVIPNASTSAGARGLLAQLDTTATQFDTVDAAIYSLDGDIEDFYSWLQMTPPNH